MTAKKIEEAIRKVYPSVYINHYPCIGLETANYHEWCIDSKSVATRDTLGKGRSAKKAWTAAYETVQKRGLI